MSKLVTSMADEITVFEGKPSKNGSYAIVAARFNGEIVDALIEGAVATLLRHGVREGSISIYRVPGAFEIPLVVNKLAEPHGHRYTRDIPYYSAIIALGAVIRGETPHFDIVANESARGLMRAMLRYGVPIANGILTTDTLEQAKQRAGSSSGEQPHHQDGGDNQVHNKGAEAALCALEMVDLIRRGLAPPGWPR